MQKTIAGVGALAALLLVTGAGAGAQPINVTVNGDRVDFEGTQPTQMNGRVLVPLRGVLEQMGAYVEWVPDNQTVIASKGDTRISLPIGSRFAMVNGQRVRLDVPAMTLAGRTMVPLRFVGESLGADVAWRPSTQTVMITTSGAASASVDNEYHPNRAHRTDQEHDRGYYDASGNWHWYTTGDNGRGYRDENGNWHGYDDQTPGTNGYYDYNGNWHWYDNDQARRIRTPGASGYYDADGSWHWYDNDRASRSRAPGRNGYYDANGDWHWYSSDRSSRGRVPDTNGYYDANGDWHWFNGSRMDRQHRSGYRTGTRIMLPAGTVIPVTLDQGLSSDNSSVGDRFTATVSDNDNAGLPLGTKFEGVVTEAVPSRNNRPGVLDVDFRRVMFPDGTTRTVDARVSSLDAKAVTRANGRLVARPGSSSNERLKWVGIGAGAGFLISSIAKGNQLLDTLLGAGAGYLYNELQHRGASNVNLRPGTEIGVRLNRQVALAP